MANVCQYGGEPKGNGTQECNCKEYTGYRGEFITGHGRGHRHWNQGGGGSVEQFGYNEGYYGKKVSEQGNCSVVFITLSFGLGSDGDHCDLADQSCDKIKVVGDCAGKDVFVNGIGLSVGWNGNGNIGSTGFRSEDDFWTVFGSFIGNAYNGKEGDVRFIVEIK